MMAIVRAFWKPLTAGGLILLALWAFSHVRYQAGYDSAISEWKLADKERHKNDALALASRQEKERNEEKRRREEAAKATAEADAQLAKARTDATDARRTGEQLHATISTLRRQLAGSETGRISAVAAAGAARANAGLLLADVLERADKRAGELAEYADGVRVRALACESIYKGTTQTH